jgi:Arf-GAP/GTPase/ANK repeat/PH domain-containing protein 1/3
MCNGSVESLSLPPPSPLQEASSWVKAIEDQIKKIISESVSHKRVDSVVTDFEKKEIINMLGNGFCADCYAPGEHTF